MEIIPTLQQLGLSDKEIAIYLALLKNGPSSVRTLAKASNINRGTTYDILKSLKESGLVSFYHKNTKQFFVTEEPSALNKVLEERMEKLKKFKQEVSQIIPELNSLFNKSHKPVVKYYEGSSGIKIVLSDVLETTALGSEKLYYIFSSAAMREYLYQAYPNFTKDRIKKKLKVKAIAVGHPGTRAPLSEKKSLHAKKSSPTYILIYPGKVAMISVNTYGQPLALIIEDEALYTTQHQIFEFIWNSL